jgi:hypothetical protein
MGALVPPAPRLFGAAAATGLLGAPARRAHREPWRISTRAVNFVARADQIVEWQDECCYEADRVGDRVPAATVSLRWRGSRPLAPGTLGLLQ